MHRANNVPRVRGPQPALGAAGYTLVELLVVIVIIGVVAAISFPSFQAMTNGNRLTSGTNELVATLQMARMEAIREAFGG